MQGNTHCSRLGCMPKISTQAAKAKGRKLQQWVRDAILGIWTSLEADDVKSTSMGAGGEDVQLSPAARRAVPYSIECKARNAIAVYAWYEQAATNAGSHVPVVFLKADRKKPLVLVDAEHFLQLVKKSNA